MKKPSCPKCKSNDVLRVVYGYIEPDSEIAGKKDVYFGGCCISDDSPAWHCNSCEHEWGKTDFK